MIDESRLSQIKSDAREYAKRGLIAHAPRNGDVLDLVAEVERLREALGEIARSGCKNGFNGAGNVSFAKCCAEDEAVGKACFPCRAAKALES